MRKGSKCKPWTVAEERWLREMGPVLGRRACCSHLKRSSSSVKLKAHRLGVSLRYWDPRCSTRCPECGSDRAQMGRSGVCRPCEIRALIAKADAETSAIMEQLGPDARTTYRTTELKLGSTLPPRPTAPMVEGLSVYEAAKTRDLHASEVEAWEVRALMRQLKAKRRRLERMRKKL